MKTLLACTLFCLALVVPGRPTGASSPLSGAHLTILPNGLRLIHREHHSAPLVAIDIWVRAGSGREGPDESGAAHFLEHLLFKGTPSRKPGVIDAAIEDLGATLSAGTTRDGAHFYATVASDQVGTALEVIADALQHSTLDPIELERERAVILDELARASNDGQKQVTNGLYADLFGADPFGRPVLGLADSIRTLKRAQVDAFYHRWYAPNNASVVLVGDIPAASAEALVAKCFGAWERRELPAEAARAVRSTAEPAAEKVQSASWLAWGIRSDISMDAATIAAGEVAARLLADGEFGRLPHGFQVAGESRKPPVGLRPSAAVLPAAPTPLKGIAAEFEPHVGGAVLSVTARASGADPATAQKPVVEALAAMAKEAATPAEIDYARRRALGAFLFETETYAGQARALGEYDVIGDFKIAVELADRIGRVDEDVIIRFARRCLELKNLGQASLPAKVGR